MYIIGLTGIIGSGKSLVSEIFSSLGVNIIDTDIIAAKLTSGSFYETKNYALIKIKNAFEVFNLDIFNLDGTLNKKNMRTVIFNNQHYKTILENILHPLIYTEVLELINQASIITDDHKNHPYLILVVPLLFKSQKYLDLTSRNIFINCDQASLIARILKRDNITQNLALQIIASQMDANLQRIMAQDILENSINISIEDLTQQVVSLHEKYLELFSK